MMKRLITTASSITAFVPSSNTHGCSSRRATGTSWPHICRAVLRYEFMRLWVLQISEFKVLSPAARVLCQFHNFSQVLVGLAEIPNLILGLFIGKPESTNCFKRLRAFRIGTANHVFIEDRIISATSSGSGFVIKNEISKVLARNVAENFVLPPNSCNHDLSFHR